MLKLLNNVLSTILEINKHSPIPVRSGSEPNRPDAIVKKKYINKYVYI